MTNDFKQLFINEISPFVGVYITKEEANEIYTVIKKQSPNFNGITNLYIDNDNKHNTHYFFANSMRGSVADIFQIHSNETQRDGAGDTIIIKNLTQNKVLKVGEKVKVPRYDRKVTILNLGSEKDGINQKVTYKTSNGATITTYKHALLDLQFV